MIGTTVLHYQVLRQIGAGAMGAVFEAFDSKLERKVALKFLHEQGLLDATTQARFAKEAKVVSKFDHPNIGVLYNLETSQQQTFLVMALYQGQTLAERISDTNLDFYTIVQFALEMASALEHAHAHGVMHRDFKPANIFVAKDTTGKERIKVLDFGLAKLQEQTQHLTKQNAMVGTLLYAAPEQLRGRFTPQSDLWAWGCVVYQMLTQSAPFQGESIGQVLNNILSHQPEPLEELRPDTPDDLLYLVSQTLEKIPADRIQSAKELISVLEQCAFELKSASATQVPKASNTGTISFPKPKLPSANTVFVGRETELANIQTLLELPHARLVTLLGLGGMGKTRLALEVATTRQDQYRDGVAFVDLTRLDNANLVPNAILNALELTVNQDAIADTLSALEFREMLLVLDNFEHLMPARELIGQILKQTNKVQILITSREVLGLQVEQLLEIGGFPALTKAPLEQQSSAQLFLQAAQKAQLDFAFQPTDHATFKRIYNALSGSPLGLTLAAAWTRMLELPEIADEIEQNIAILETSASDIPERQRSFSAVFESSWRYLSDTEQMVLAKLTVFRGGFSKEWAKRVAGANLLVLQGLIQKSLISRKDNRYAIHELIKQFAEKQLSDEARDDAMEALGQCCLELSEEYLESNSKQIREMTQKVAMELHSIREGLVWLTRKDPSKGALIVIKLDLFWTTIGLHQEMMDWVVIFEKNYLKKDKIRCMILKTLSMYFYSKRNLELAEKNIINAKEIVELMQLNDYLGEIFLVFCFIEMGRKNSEKAEEYLNKAIYQFEKDKNFNKLSYCYNNLAQIYSQKNYFFTKHNEINELYIKSIRYAKLSKDEFAVPQIMLNQAMLARKNNDYTLEKLIINDALIIARSLDNFIALIGCLNRLGIYFFETKAYFSASKYFIEALEISFRLNHTESINVGIFRISDILFAARRFEEAFRVSIADLNIYHQLYPRENIREKWCEKSYPKMFEQGFTQEQLELLEAEANALTLEESVQYAIQTLQSIMPELEAHEPTQA